MGGFDLGLANERLALRPFMARVAAYVRRDGDCREMMEFYRAGLGGKLELTMVKDTPAAKDLPAAMHNRVMHGTLRGDSFSLTGSDLPDPAGHKPGNDWALVVECSSEDELKRLFERLSVGGTVQRPPGPQFWGGLFAQFTDKFDVDWMLNYQSAAPTR